MDPTSLIKALLINAAYEGSAAVCGPLIQGTDGKTIPIDPLVQDSNLQSKGLLVYEEAKIQYAVLVKAFQDTTGIWPNPVVPSVSATQAAKQPAGASSAVAALTALAKAPGTAASVVTLINQLIPLLQQTAAAVTSPTPATTGTAPVAPALGAPVSQ